MIVKQETKRNKTSRNETKRDTTETKQDKAETKRNETKRDTTETKLFFLTWDNNPQNASGGLKNL